MHKKLKLATSIIAILVLIFFLYGLVNYRILDKQISERVESYVGKYGYSAVFVLSFILEFSPQPFIGAVGTLASGLVFGLNFYYLLILVMAAGTLSAITAYSIGKIYGKRFVIRLFGRKNYEKYNLLFRKYGKLAISMAALTPIPYFPIIAGVFKMKAADFAIYALFVRLIHFVVFSYLLLAVLS